MKRTIKFLVWISLNLLISFFLSACSSTTPVGKDENSPTVQSTSTNSLTPTATVVIKSTPMPTPAEATVIADRGLQKIGFECNEKAAIINIDGTGYQELGSGHFPTWSPLKPIFLAVYHFYNNHGDFIDNINVNIMKLGPQEMVWSPVDDKIAFTVGNNDNGMKYDIYTTRPDGSEIKNITNNPGNYVSSLSWSKDGKKLAYYQGDSDNQNPMLCIVDADGINKRCFDYSKEQSDPNDSYAYKKSFMQQSVSWSPDNRHVLANYSFRFFIVDTQTGERKSLGYESASGDWSPDGKTILLSSANLIGNVPDSIKVFFVTDSGGGETDLPKWSPDGKKIAYYVWARSDIAMDDVELWVMNSDGSGELFLKRCTNGLGGTDQSPTWSH